LPPGRPSATLPPVADLHQRWTDVAPVIVELRWRVGGLGERLGWWPSLFTKAEAERSIAMLFPKTSRRARLESVSAVARRAHDAALSPRAFHLFRLPSSGEAAVADFLAESDPTLIALPASSTPEWLESIDARGRALGAKSVIAEPSPGPNHLGTPERLAAQTGLGLLLRMYVAAARNHHIAFPYVQS